jgi:LmbE family N-acetylglucosaminyl deacetylase
MTMPGVFIRQSRVMVIAPHPDDESLAAGGLLQQAISAQSAVRILFLTGGDNNPWPQRLIEGRWRIGAEDKMRWAALRRQETMLALAWLGVPPEAAVFLGYPDQGLSDLLLRGDDDLIQRLTDEIIAWQPTLLVTPSLLDLHPDHSAAGVFVKMALARLGQGLHKPRQIEYLINFHESYPANGEVFTVSLPPEQQHRKRMAICRHESQGVFFPHHMLAFAGKTENFILTSNHSEGVNPCHPVRQANITAEELVLKLEMSACRGVFDRAMLCLLTSCQSRAGIRISMVLPRWSVGSPIEIHDINTGQVITHAKFCGNYHRAEVKIPLSFLGPMEQCFLKLERRFGFFDEAGWLELTNNIA